MGATQVEPLAKPPKVCWNAPVADRFGRSIYFSIIIACDTHFASTPPTFFWKTLQLLCLKVVMFDMACYPISGHHT